MGVLQISFTEFDLEAGYDFVRVSSCESAACLFPVEIKSVEGIDTIDLDTSVARIVFTSDGSVQKQGFSASWSLLDPPCNPTIPTNSFLTAYNGAGNCDWDCFNDFYAFGQSCTACPDNSAAPAGSTSSSACVCTAGYSGQNGGPCTSASCEAGQYKPSGSPCTTCASGSFKETAGSGLCSVCGAGTFHAGSATAATCAPCPDDSFTWGDLFQSVAQGSCTSTISTGPSCSTTVSAGADSGGLDTLLTISVEQTDFGLSSEIITLITVGDQAIPFDSLATGGSDGACGTFVTVVDKLSLQSVPGWSDGSDVSVMIETSSSVNCCPCSGLYLNAVVELHRPSPLLAVDCSCNVGYTGPDAGPCTVCSPGTVKLETGP
eukprot:3792179-Rhodomonas_salina.1